ncbi:MAG TPA: nitrate reductase molybdenum cofactor assembly chaperone [Gaiellaceae bacterium]
MSAYALLSVLLQYPSAETDPADGDVLREVERLPRGAAHDGIAAFLAARKDTLLAAAQAEYVETFDFDRRASLYLTYHSHGDRRQRGIELVRLKRRFHEAGLVLADGELPDYLPALLEFAALVPAADGEALLAELRPQLELVRSRLHERGSPYAHLLDAVVTGLPPLTRAQAERARRLAEEGPPTELVGLDSPPVPEPVA